MWRDRTQDDSGAALVFAMLATLVVAGLIAVMASRSVTEARVTASARDRETAIHVAEAGIDDVIVEVNADDDYVTLQADGVTPHEFTPALNATQAEERAWAIAVASDTTQCVVVPADHGEACGIRPMKNGAKLPWIFGVGFVPSRDNPVKVRVVKVQYDKGFFSPAKAILTNGDLTLGATICGDAADVHTNSNVTILGGGDTVSCAEPDGNVTSTGSFGSGGSVGTDSGQVNRSETIPYIRALSVYAREAANEANRGNPSADQYEGKWFDLCPDGRVRRPLVDGLGELVLASGEPQPCAGPILYEPGDSAAFVGWSLQGGGGSQRWTSTAAMIPDGVYYVYELDAEINGNLGGVINLTILADGKGTIQGQPDTGTGCTLNGSDNGNIRITGVGGGAMNPYLQDLLFLADRDFVTTGNTSTTVHGVVLAHEQVELGGTVTVTGAVMAEGACPSSPGSPVNANDNKVFGNFQLTHNGDLSLPLDSVTRITAWNEL
jgi:hypothetical protein